MAFFILSLCLSSCTNDVLPPPDKPGFCDSIMASYNTNVKAIIDESCAYSGCHDGSGGIGPGNYSSYSGILPVLESTSFRNRVLVQKTMLAWACRPMPPFIPSQKKMT